MQSRAAAGTRPFSDAPLDVEASMEGLAADVRDTIAGWLENPRQAGRGRCALQGILAAGRAGFSVQGVVARGLFEVRGEAGSAVLAPLAFETRDHEAGAIIAQQKLRRALESAITDRRYVLHIRQPLSDDFDPAMVVQAVTVWQHAVRRGEYTGTDAVYQDDGVHIEFSLTDYPRVDNALLLQANPTPGLERMGVVGAILLRLAAFHASIPDVGPLIPCLGAEPTWRLSRGHVEQVLFGTARETHVICGSEPSYAATFSSDGALFGEPEAARLGSVWWFERAEGGGCRAWAHDNPWCAQRESVPAFPGLRFAVQDIHPDRGFRLGWTSR